ncbi:hypothetical protein MTIN_08570 [Moorella thermoacetica]|nr:hypothetical protein MTIN_08570 [Moorella thermoacetica]
MGANTFTIEPRSRSCTRQPLTKGLSIVSIKYLLTALSGLFYYAPFAGPYKSR